MKKIAIITAYYKNYNYGGLLQTYALQRVINIRGADAITLSYKANAGSDNFLRNVRAILKNNYKTFSGWKVIVGLVFSYLKYPFQKKQFEPYIDKLKVRTELFDKFMIDDILHSEIYDAGNIKKSVKKYDCFITGSDQVFHPSKYDNNYFLDFVPESKEKYSYAASIGRATLSSEELANMKKCLSGFRAVSVRENSAKDMLDKILNKPTEVNLDPTLLLDKEEWEKKEKAVDISTPYVFVYLLGDNKKNFDLIEKCSDILGVPIVYLPIPGKGYNKVERNFGDKHLFEVGPREFLWLIHNAEYVCTDSFHGIVFSILFQKKFLGFKRNSDKDVRNMNDRLYTLLNELHLQDRMVDALNVEKQLKQSIDYTKVAVELENLKDTSFQYLDKIIRT